MHPPQSTEVSDAGPAPNVQLEAAQAPGGSNWRKRLLTRKFLVVSVLVHLLFASGAAVWVVNTSSVGHKRTFVSLSARPSAASRALEHKMQQKQKRVMSAPVAVKRVTALAPSKFSLPTMPIMPTQPAHIIAATQITGMGGTGTGIGMGGSGVGTGFANGGAGVFMASIGGLSIKAKRLAVALDVSGSVAKYQQSMQAHVARTFKDSEVATFESTSFKTGSNALGGVLLGFLNSPKPFDAIYIFSDFKTVAKNQEEAWAQLQKLLEEKKVRLYLHVLQEYNSHDQLTPSVSAAIAFAKSSGGSVKIGPMVGM